MPNFPQIPHQLTSVSVSGLLQLRVIELVPTFRRAATDIPPVTWA